MAKRKRKGGANPPTGEGDSPPVSAAFFGAIDEFEDADVFDVYALLCGAERERRTAIALAPHAEQDTLGQRARSDHAWRLAAKLLRRLLIDSRFVDAAGWSDGPHDDALQNPPAESVSAARHATTGRPADNITEPNVEIVTCVGGTLSGWDMIVVRQPRRLWVAVVGDRQELQLIVRATGIADLPALPEGARVRGYYKYAAREPVMQWNPVLSQSRWTA